MKIRNFRTASAVALISLLITESCNENSNVIQPQQGPSGSTVKSLSNARVVNYSFTGAEGDPIDQAVASRWIENYFSKNNGVIAAHYFGKNILSRMLSQTGGVGIRFYYSKADDGIDHLQAVPAGANGNDFPNPYRAIGKNASVALLASGSSDTFTGTESDSLSSQTATQFVANYNASNSGGIQAHFFGYELIRQILSENNCVGIRCYYALNDNGVQQLLLVGVTGAGSNILPSSTSTGRTNDGGGTIGDVSSPCPTYCSQ